MKKHLVSIQALNFGTSHTKTLNRNLDRFLNALHKEGAEGGGATGEDTEAELKELTEKVKEGILGSKDIKDVIATAKEFKSLNDKVLSIESEKKEFASTKEFKELQSETNKLALELKALVEKPVSKEQKKEFKSFGDAVLKQLEEKKELFDNYFAGKQKDPITIELKAAIDISDLATIQAVTSASQTSLTTFSGLISPIRKRLMTYLDNVSKSNITVSEPYAMWMEEVDEQGLPVFIAEGAQATQLSVRYEERRMEAQQIAVFGKITDKFMRNLPQLVGYIQNNLMKRQAIKVEDQLFNGDNTGNDLKGLMEYASAFTGAGMTGVPFANEMDVIKAIALQVIRGNCIPTGIFVDYSLITKLGLEKTTQGAYIIPPFTDMNGKVVDGLKIIGTNAFANAGLPNYTRLFVGGDLSVINVGEPESLSIQIGLDGYDMTQMKKTILLNQQIVQFVSANDVQGLVQGNFDAAITAIS